jgi:hypothetical protein
MDISQRQPDCDDDGIVFVKVKVKVRSRLLSISRILNFKLILIDAM